MSTTLPPSANTQERKLLDDLQKFPNIFSHLMAIHDDSHDLFAKVSVSDYSGMIFLVNDLLKAILIVLESDEYTGASGNDKPNVNSLLDLAIQLLPLQEIELLDILHQYHLNNNDQ